MVFRGRAMSGIPAAQPPETIDVQFFDFDKEQVEGWIKSLQIAFAVDDARNSDTIVYESYEVRPYRLVDRIMEKLNPAPDVG